MRPIALEACAAVLLIVAAVSAPVFAHDMAAMDDMDAANGMGAHMDMGAHMKMTELRIQTPQDVERARDILATLRRVLPKYRNYRVALAEGYRIFLPAIPQPVYHFTDLRAASAEYSGRFDPAHPGSLLYSKIPNGDYVLVGAMYSAPPDDTPEQLDAFIPLGVARWHEHVNICLPAGIAFEDFIRGDVGADRDDLPGMIPIAANPEALELDRRLGFLADGRFGFHGKISNEPACREAGGHFIPLAFGWMVHVYPFAGDDLKVAYGMDVPNPPSN